MADEDTHRWVLHVEESGDDFEYTERQLNQILEVLGGDHELLERKSSYWLKHFGQVYIDGRRAALKRPKPGQTADQLVEAANTMGRLMSLMDQHFFNCINDRSGWPIDAITTRFQPAPILELLFDFKAAAERAAEIERKIVPREVALRGLVWDAVWLWEETTNRYAGNVKDFREFVLCLLRPLDDWLDDRNSKGLPRNPERVVDYLKKVSRVKRELGKTPGKVRG